MKIDCYKINNLINNCIVIDNDNSHELIAIIPINYYSDKNCNKLLNNTYINPISNTNNRKNIIKISNSINFYSGLRIPIKIMIIDEQYISMSRRVNGFMVPDRVFMK